LIDCCFPPLVLVPVVPGLVYSLAWCFTPEGVMMDKKKPLPGKVPETAENLRCGLGKSVKFLFVNVKCLHNAFTFLYYFVVFGSIWEK